jgi:hypothetical protein
MVGASENEVVDSTLAFHFLSFLRVGFYTGPLCVYAF